MDRIEFTNSLKCTPHIQEYFDEFMTCYDLIACYNTLDIQNYSILDNKNIMFNVLTPYNSADYMKNILDNTVLSKYGNKYIIKSSKIDQNNLNIVLIKFI